MEYALKLSNVCKEYDSSEFALDNVTFDLPTGTVMGFVGENGAGKTTTIGCILNTLKKTFHYFLSPTTAFTVSSISSNVQSSGGHL